MLEVQPTTLSLTDAAASKLRELTAEETNPDIGLRVYVYSGGCSGFRYGMMIEDSPAGGQHPRGQRRQGLRRRQEHRPPPGQRDRLRRHAHGRGLHGQQSERRRGLWLRLELPDGRRRGYRPVLLALTHPRRLTPHRHSNIPSRRFRRPAAFCPERMRGASGRLRLDSRTMELPLFPLHTVLCPGIALPLHIFEPRYRRLVEACLDRRRAVRCRPHPRGPRGRPGADVAGPGRHDRRDPRGAQLEDGRYEILVVGTERFAIEDVAPGPPSTRRPRSAPAPSGWGIRRAVARLADRVSRRFVDYLSLLQPGEGEEAADLDVQVEVEVARGSGELEPGAEPRDRDEAGTTGATGGARRPDDAVAPLERDHPGRPAPAPGAPRGRHDGRAAGRPGSAPRSRAALARPAAPRLVAPIRGPRPAGAD